MRVVDKRVEEYTHYIGRGGGFGNPFTHLPLNRTQAVVQVNTIEDAVKCFGDWARGDRGWAHVWPKKRIAMLQLIAKLPEEAVLGCYGCKPCCHGDEIIKLWYEIKEGKLCVSGAGV